MLLKRCTQYISKFGKLSSGQRTGKGQFSFLLPKQDSAKERSNYHTTVVKAKYQPYRNQRSTIHGDRQAYTAAKEK